MSTFQFTFRDIDHPERTTTTTTEGLDERWALQDALDQLQQASADQAWQLIDTTAVDTDGAPEEDPAP